MSNRCCRESVLSTSTNCHKFTTFVSYFVAVFLRFFFNRKTFVESVIKIVLPPDDMENVKGENVLPQSK